MSTGYGVNKGKDGNKYNTLNLTTYKGRSVDSSKHSGTAVRHGLKSLGKVASTRRVPPPASLPSLKSENLGNDPNVNLVPKDGSGWASKSEQQNSQQSQQVSQAPPESQPRQASTMHSQQQSTFQASNQSVPNNRNQNSSTLTTSGQSHHTWGSSQFSQVGRKASGAIDGGRGRGITPFSDEFPTLSDTQKDAENSQNNDKTREQQYGPGPSLRPQNVASWREGGGRNLPPTKDINVDDTKSQNDSQQSSISAHGYDMNSNMDGSQVQSMSQRGIGHQGMGPNPPQNHSNIGSGTQGYPIMSSHSQGHPSQYRQNAIPQQYMYRVGHPSGMGPPGPRGRYPPNMYPGGMRHPNFSNDPRFRGMMRSAHPQQGRNESVNVPPIIPHSDFKNFDKLDDDEGDWAGMHGEVDYQEKLVFSDDEDVSDKKRAMLRENSSNEHSNIEKHRKEVSLSRQVWAPQPNSYGNMDPHSMQQWNPPYYGGYGGPGPSPLDMRSKPQMGYDKRMPAQGQQYPAAQIGPMYGRSAGPRYMMDPSSLERESPGGEEEHRRKDKEEAMERAKKRKEDEERRMAMQHRSISDERSYPPMMSKPDPRYQQHFDPSDDGMKRWSPNIPDYAPQDGYNQRRPENENSDDRRNMRDRMPTDGFGQYRAQPHPSAGSQSGGRNLPPRLANQQRQQQQERWQQPRIPSPNYQGYDNWGMSLQQTYKQEEPRIRTSIMKRDRMGSEGSEDYDIGSRSRKQSDTGFHSQMMGEKDTVLEDRRHGGRDFYRKEKKVIDDKRNTDNTSPSTAGSDREQRLWDGGSKRSLMKRQSSRDSPVIMASTGDSRRGSQKTLLSRSDSGNKPVTKLGSCQSNKSLDKDEGKQLTVRTRRSEKVKLRDFRVEGDDDNENGGISKKPSGRSGSDKLGGEPNMASEPRTWKSDTKVTKPIATVLPSTSTTSTVTKVSEQKKTAVTSSGVQDEEPINDSSQETSSLGGEQEVSQTPQGVSTTHTKSIRRSEPRSHPNKDRHDNKDRRPRTTPRENRDHYEERSDRNERRYKESRQHERDAPRERHNDNRPRRYDDSKSRPQDRQRRNDDRYENRNSREGKEQRRDGKREHMQEQFKVPSNQQTRKGEMSKTSKPTSEKPATSVATTMSTVTSTAVTSTTLKQTMAAPSPTTNIWEERKKLMQKDGEKNTYIPKEEDKKRTLKETAPVMKVDVEIKSNRDDKPSMDSKKHFREETNNKSARGYNKSSSFNEKRSYDGGFSYRDNGQRRGSSSRQPPGNDRKQSVENSYESRNEKRGGRGRGRSRGSSYPRGGGRGRGGQTTSLDKPSSTTRGRGRGSRRGGYSRSTYSRGSHGGRPNQSKSYYGDGDYSDSSSDGSYSGSDNPSFDNRRRKVGEASDAEDYSTESFTDDEYFSTNPQISKRPAPSHQENIAKPETSRSNNGNFASKPNFSESHNNTFAARGEPSRRGRGRGTSAGTTRGRGRGGYNQSRNNISAPPNGRGRRSDDYQDTSRVSKNGERGPQGGAGRRRGVSQSDDKRKRTRKADKPPRFKNNTSRSSNRDFSSRDNNLPPFNGTAGRQDEVSPSGDVQAISSDVGNDEWETASDNSSDFRKVTLKTSEPDDGKRSEPKRSFTTQRPSSANRGHGGKGGNSGRGHYDRSGNSKTNSQVYTLHGVDYSNPSAIEGALRDASLNQDFDKMKKAPKSRHEELFRRYDLHNYAGVVSVDDLPDVSSKRMLQNEQDIISDDVLDAVMDFSPVAGNKDADDDGFTPVLSKRALKKKQGEMRKKDEEEKMLQAVRKMKLKQQQKNRQKFFGKQNHIASGTSGSIKQPISSTNLQSELWPNIETWKPQENAPEQIEACADVSISQHDSGVESSVPSSQRSSPGTEAKLSFSHFGVSITSTSVITSICDHQVSSTSSVIHESVGIAGLMKEKQNNIDLKESDLMSGLKESSPASSSPSRSNGNMIRPIGNERVKIMKVSEPVDNIASLFHSVKDKNVISFVAENSDESGNPNTVSNLFPSDELRDNTFSPFGEPPIPQSVSGMIDSTSRHGFPSFSQSDFTEVTVQPTLSVHSSTYLSISQFTKSANSSGESPTTHSLVNNPASNLSPTPEAAMMEQHVGNFRHPMQSSALPNGFLTPLSPSINKLPLNKAGASSESDPTEDMSLNPQAPTNPNVTHNPHSLEGSSIPEPIPLPPKYPTGSSQGPDGDVQAGVMPALDVNAKATGAGDMGLMTPTSPSNDLNIKMELGRKAWENMLESSSAPSQQQGANTFHQSTDTVHLPEQTVVETSNVQSVSLSVTKSTEWKPRQHSSTPTASSGSSESWRNTTSQPHQGQISQTQDFVKNTAVTAGSETTSSTLGLYRSGTTVTVATTQTPHHQPVAPPYSSGYMYFDPNSQIFSPTPRVATVQGSHSNLYQTISATSLATNLHNMQHAYPTNLPPDYAPSLYTSQNPGYSSLTPQVPNAGYSAPQHRDYVPNQPMLLTSAVGSATIKPSPQNTLGLKPSQQPHQAALRSGSATANYGAGSSMPSMNQTNIGSAQLTIPRQHGGAVSPAQPIFIPVLDQSRVIAGSQANPSSLINQALNTPQRPQSTSFYSQLNQGNSSYYPQQPGSQLHRQQGSYQQALSVPSYPQGISYHAIKPMSPTQPTQMGMDAGSGIWTLGNVQQTAAYQPIAPPSHRLGNDNDSSQQSMQYYASKGPYLGPNKVSQSVSQTSGGFGVAKPSIPSSTYGGNKTSQSMYPPSDITTPSNQDQVTPSGHSMSKYSMPTSSASKAYMGQQDWSKPASSTSLQYRQYAVQGLLSRPFSSSIDSMTQQSPSNTSYSGKPQDMTSSRMTFRPPNPSQSHSFNPQQAGWGHSKPPQGNPGLMGSQPLTNMLTTPKGPRPPMVPSSMMGQGYTNPQVFQASSSLSPPQMSSQQPVPYPMNMGGGGGMRITSPTSVPQQFGPMHDNRASAKHGKGGKQGHVTSSHSTGKAPPVPTLVRGAGSNLVGKKPTFMSEEVIKSKQASERANLLESLSSFFPDKAKDDGEKGGDTAAPARSPPPKRRPGMRSAGIEKRRMGGDMKNGGKNSKRSQKNGRKEESADVDSIVRPVKKMTLADTKPKKGETAKIQLKGQAKP